MLRKNKISVWVLLDDAQEIITHSLYRQLAFQNSNCFMFCTNGQHCIKCQSLLFIHQCLLWKKMWVFFYFPPQTPKNSDTGKMIILFSTQNTIIYTLSYSSGWKCFHLGEWCKLMRMGALKNKIGKEKSFCIKSVIEKIANCQK